MHHSRWKRHGDPLVVINKTTAGGFTALDRFRDSYEVRQASEYVDTPCWLWTRGTNDAGYGRLTVADGEADYAHRWSYLHHVGEIPEGLQLDHLCRIRRCVNPDHLEPVTSGENTRRGSIAEVNRERASEITECPEGHPYTPENTYVHDGSRGCRICRRKATQEWRARQKISATHN